MPELPEVETIKRDLSKLIVDKRILDITTDSAKQVRPSLKTVKKAIVGSKLTKIDRRAKLLILKLDSQETRRIGKFKPDGFKTALAIHLKLTGRLLVRDKDHPPDDWQHITITLTGGKELRFCDLRKFGWIKMVNSNESLVMINELGVEPFEKEFTVDYLKQIFAKTSRPIKIILMDQAKIAGIGNIYANDGLFLARIDPRRPAKKLGNKEIGKLRKAIIKVLKAGIKYRGASEQHYLDALGHKGSYQDHFLVYQRDGEKCFNCGGKIKRIKLAGRGTFFCPPCQR